ncbi:ABC transporter permease [Bailinhaonella thermotolerans]|uniref:ABC transporter permease n=1 Tax=Bailinhaonella thermotolerans TaxID=1070861 RepID=A0A3A4AU17_9ACTN|nr:ABC transporter permease [Bailinhaonella thermotolerans]RJL32119.1 ABC transporter permease [Bailinhaonella thermotolerans]
MRAGFADIALAEWIKFRSVPGHLYGWAAAVVLMVVMGALTAHGAAGSHLAAPPAERASFDPVFTGMYGGFLFAQIAMGALGVLSVTSEYATGTIRATLTVVPRRTRLLAAKSAALGVIALVTGLVAAPIAFLAGQAVLARRGAPSAGLAAPGAPRAVLGMALLWVLAALTGLALGVLIRRAALALTVLVTLDLLIPVVAPRVLSDAGATWLARYWPPTAGLRIIATVPDPALLAPWAGLGLLVTCTAALLVAAGILFRARDA